MATVPCNNRITIKRKRPNPLFQDWLEELYEEATAKNSKLIPMLREALISISKYPLPLNSGAECVILKGFNKKLCVFLDQRLEAYHSLRQERESSSESDCQVIEPDTKTSADLSIAVSTSNVAPESSNLPLGCINDLLSCSNETKLKEYKPKYRSGAYAILRALLENFRENHDPSLTKDCLIDKAQKYSEESFLTPKLQTFCTAWSIMSTLIDKGWVQKTSNEKEYFLTSFGIAVTKYFWNTYDENWPENEMYTSQINPEPSGLQDTSTTESVTPNVLNTPNDSEETNIIEMPARSYEIILLIDKCETGGVAKKKDPMVAQFNKYPNLKYEYRSLKIGDYCWIAQHKINKEQELVLPFIVERKRMDDLANSIKDGRYYEQKFRLRKSGIKKVFYLVENFGNNTHLGLPIQSLMQALNNTRIQDGFQVHVTNSLIKSVKFLVILTKRLIVEYEDRNIRGSDKKPDNDDLMTFRYLSKASSKTKPLTLTDTFIKLLLQLKGLSVERALAITSVYKTPVALYKAYENCKCKDKKEALLADLKFSSTSPKVGLGLSRAIYHLFNLNDVTLEDVYMSFTEEGCRKICSRFRNQPE